MKECKTALKKLFLWVTLALVILNACRSPTANDENNGKPCICPPPLEIDINAAWSPDGQTIAFYRGSHALPDSFGIYLISPDGRNLRLWLKGFAFSPAWSPDGQWLAFNLGNQIYKRKLNGDSLTQLTFDRENHLPAWSPDGKWIAYDSNSESSTGANFVWKMKTDGSEKRRIAYTPTEGETRQPNWSWDNKTILHIRYLLKTFSSEIFRMDENGGNVVRLTFNNATDYSPKYSSDGKMIAFASQPSDGRMNIWLMNSDGTKQHQLTNEGGIDPAWSHDSQWILYTSHENGRLWKISLDGSRRMPITF
jgi:Tol biopolymer transport system component